MTYTDVVTYLYWMLLLLVTAGSLVCAILAFRQQKRVYAIASAGALAAALFIAAVSSGEVPPAFAVLLAMLALALAVIGGAPMATLALNLAMKNSSPGQNGGILIAANAANPAAPHDPATGAPVTSPALEVLRGGLTIGILERFAAAGAILLGFPEAIAIVVAIKGVGRFTELSAPESRERFIIGTFASLIWACACGALLHIAVS